MDITSSKRSEAQWKIHFFPLNFYRLFFIAPHSALFVPSYIIVCLKFRLLYWPFAVAFFSIFLVKPLGKARLFVRILLETSHSQLKVCFLLLLPIIDSKRVMYLLHIDGIMFVCQVRQWIAWRDWVVFYKQL